MTQATRKKIATVNRLLERAHRLAKEIDLSTRTAEDLPANRAAGMAALGIREAAVHAGQMSILARMDTKRHH